MHRPKPLAPSPFQACAQRLALFLGAALCATACTPAMDWREIRPEGSRVQLQWPCKPASHSRQVRLAGAAVSLTLYACNAAGATWALGFADIGDPGRVGTALQELAAAAAANVQGAGATAQAWAPPGATPNPHNQRHQAAGRLPDGTAITQHVAVFALGTQVHQATALGARLDDEALANFFAQVKVLP